MIQFVNKPVRSIVNFVVCIIEHSKASVNIIFTHHIKKLNLITPTQSVFRKKSALVFLLLWTVVFCVSGTAQVTFSKASTVLPTPTFKTWLQKGVADMNADGLDDIVRADQQGNFFILKQQPNGSFIEQALGKIQSRTPLSVILADIDNNGYADILTGGEYNGVRVVKANANGTAYTIIRLPQDSIFTQASALADINNDGLLDAFVCNDDSTNGIWRNAGNGSFVKDQMGFDFSSVPLNRHSGNYGIVFTDFDNDGDNDAYLSKCSHWAMKDSTDQRRINQLFINNANQ
jgi:FG-GAP-like repeat